MIFSLSRIIKGEITPALHRSMIFVTVFLAFSCTFIPSPLVGRATIHPTLASVSFVSLPRVWFKSWQTSRTEAAPPAPVPPPAPTQTKTLSYPLPKDFFKKSNMSSYLVLNTSSALVGFFPAPPSPIKSLFESGIFTNAKSCLAVFMTPTLL